MTAEEPPEADVARRAVDDARPRLAEQLLLLGAVGDPTRLALLVAVHAAPGAPVKALAAATGLTANTATQALASLLATGAVRRVRDGRLSRWYLCDEAAHALLHHLGAPHGPLHRTHPLP